jgi:hypothetical protein
LLERVLRIGAEARNEPMHERQMMKTVPLILLAVAIAAPAPLRAQGPSGPRTDALAAVTDVMALRRGALGDPLPFDACTVFEKTGRPSGFPASLSPGLVPLLDRTGPDPCATEPPVADPRFPRAVQVDSVMVTDSAAAVHLSIWRGEWRYKEDYYFRALPNGRGWGFRESRMTHPFRVTPPPRRPE